jgi:hypothetical protein
MALVRDIFGAAFYLIREGNLYSRIEMLTPGM